MKYKFCDYLLPSYNDDNDLIIHNTLYNNTILIKHEDLIKFNDLRTQILVSGEYVGSPKNIQLLLENKILLPYNYDMQHDVDNVYRKTIKDSDTLELTILPTEKCNFRCIYCYEDFSKGKMNDATILRTEMLIDKLLPNYNALYVSWFGGEPLLALDIIESISEKVITKCKTHKKIYYAGITTNGYLLTADTVKQLIKHHILTYQITIDGNEETHDKQRPLYNGKATYKTIINNLLNIKNTIKTHTIKFIIRVNITDDIYGDSIKQLYNLFQDDPRFIINPQRVFSTSRYSQNNNDYTAYIDKLKTCGVTLKDSFSPHDTICYAARQHSLIIRSDGTLTKCSVNFDDHQNNFGNICDIDISNFNMSKYQYCNSRNSIKICIKCPVYPICFGVQCPARQTQPCKEIISKYSLLVRSLEDVATHISL